MFLFLALASTMWPVWIISAIWVFGMVFSIIFWILFFKEHLKLIQYFWIFIIILGILWIKVLS